MAGTLNSTLLTAAMRKAGMLLAAGRGAAPEDTVEAISEENRMIAGWNANPLNIFSNRLDLWTTIARQQSYTIGKDPTGTSTADWDGDRPQEITRANFLLPTASTAIEKVRRPLKLWDKRQWMNIRFQAVYTYPEILYYDRACDPTTGFARIYFRPIPDGAYQVELSTCQQIPQFASASDVVILPPGAEDAIVNNLAVRLAAMPWTRQRALDPQVRVDAVTSLAVFQQMNLSCPRLHTDAELTNGAGYLSWMTGEVEQ